MIKWMLFFLIWFGLIWTFEIDRTEINNIYVVNETTVNNVSIVGGYTLTERPDWVVPENVPEYVTVTVYQPTMSQCDADPDVLADGTKINVYKAGGYRYCALSRDLLTRWGGSIAYKRVDLLVGLDDKTNYKFENTQMRRVM